MNGILIRSTRLEAAAQFAPVAVFVALLLLALSGSFDRDMNWLVIRILYWMGICLLSLALLDRVQQQLRRTVPRLPDAWLRLAALALLLPVMNGIIMATCKLMFGGTPSLHNYAGLLPVTGTILIALHLILIRREGAQPAPERHAQDEQARELACLAPPAAADLRCKLPLPLRAAPIQALQAEDHYVRVYTAAGTALVRMRLGDAIAALGDHEGVRPHRSWWVAIAAVRGVRRDGSRTVLELGEGREVPVSRRMRAQFGTFRSAGVR